MRALIYHQSNPIVDRLRMELIQANKNIRFSETTDYKEAMELFIRHRPEIIILGVDLPDGSGNKFLRNIKNLLSNIREVNLSNHPNTKIILLNFTKAEHEIV
jgi:two-component SAPR family response regulator